ncbi:MAG: hypothetical protein SCARUB_03357 [Candidatus Scalindua rubra]|uniref:Lumazine-binding domain protein n=1 Tax=Candidatus Scalindua rubra TaxID=1872076 RepID=A0A1E3X7C1_9BACT|nr:MAG: hypothetical protein SCARUB_03357 [Candidatus Scalindua rubra]
MKRIIAVLSLVVIIVFTTRTASSRNSPDIVVEKYLTAVRANDYEKAYTFISKSDNTIIEWLEQLRYIKQIAPPQLIALIDIAHSASKQEIVKTTVEGDNAIVEIHSLVPDMKETLKITNRVQEIKSLLDQDILPMREKEGIFKLIVEGDLWKISMMRGVTADQAAEIASDLAEQILGKEEAEKLSKKIKEFFNRDTSPFPVSDK